MSTPDSFANSHTAGHVIGGGRYSLHVTLSDGNLVWLAQDEVEQRLAAIRFFPGEIRSDARAMDVLRTRLQKTLAIKHPNLARLMEWYEADGVEPFVASEYIEGSAIRQSVASAGNAGASWEKLQPIAAQVAAALSALHGAGVVHHGVCPENIIVSADGAKLLNPVISGVLRNPLFFPGALKQPEALRCSSPQQLAGADATVADDFYALGATLFELLTGSPVFADSKTLLGDIRAGISSTVPMRLRAAAPSLPTGALEFILGCLSKDPGQRPVSFEALGPVLVERAPVQALASEDMPSKVVPLVLERAEVLAPAQTALLKQARASMPRRSRMPLLAAACIVACAVIGAGAWYVNQTRAEKQRLASAQADAQKESDRLREIAAEKQRQADLLEAKIKADARLAAETARKAKEEQSSRAAVEQERRRINNQLTAQPAVQLVKGVAPKLSTGPLAPSGNDQGFLSLFNGRDLSDWTGDTNIWSVVDGVITAQLPPIASAHKRFYLISKKGTVDDFELQFGYRFRVLRGNKQPNGGVVYRATTNAAAELSAYQFDVAPDIRNAGAVHEDKRRYRLAGFGESSIARTNDKIEVVEQVCETNKLALIRPEDWNECSIVVKGNHITHYINGNVVADFVDENTKKLRKSGMVALELYSRNTNNAATFMQFRDLKLKRLPKDSRLVSVTP